MFAIFIKGYFHGSIWKLVVLLITIRDHHHHEMHRPFRTCERRQLSAAALASVVAIYGITVVAVGAVVVVVGSKQSGVEKSGVKSTFRHRGGGHDFARDARVADVAVVGSPGPGGVFVGDEAQRRGVEAVALHF